MTSNKQSAPCNKHCMPSDKRKGFTLLEVLVALAVLAAGAVALGHYAGAFNSAVAAVAYLDSLAASLPPCVDTVLMRADALPAPRPYHVVSPSKIRAVYTPVPGQILLQWVEVRSGNFTLRRLVRCARVSR